MSCIKNSLRQEFPTRIILCAIIGIFSFLVLSHGINFPNADDYDSILDFTNRFLLTPSIFDKFILLFERHTQHFRTIDRLIAVSQYYLFGEVNFYFYLILGIAGLVLLFLLIESLIENKSKLITLSIALLLFQPCYAEVTQWPNNCIQVIWVNIFTLLAFKLCQSNITSTILNACLALLIQANGVLTIPIVILGHIRNLSFNRRFFIFLCSFIAILLIFNFKELLHSGAPKTNLNLLPKLIYSTEMIGSGIGYLNRDLSLIVGLIIVSALIYFFSTLKETEKPLVYFLTFLFLSCVSTAQFRYGLDHRSSYTTGRYTFVSILALITSLTLIHNRFSQRDDYSKLLAPILLLSACFNLQSYLLYSDQYALRSEQISDSRIRWHLFRKGLLYNPELRAIQILDNSENLKTFTIREIPLNDYFSLQKEVKLNPSNSKSPVTWSIDHALCSKKYILIDGWAVKRKYDSGKQKVFLTINKQAFLASKRTRPDVNISITKRAHPKIYDKSGFFFLIDRQKISWGIKSISLEYLNENGDWSKKNLDPINLCSSDNSNSK